MIGMTTEEAKAKLNEYFKRCNIRFINNRGMNCPVWIDDDLASDIIRILEFDKPAEYKLLDCLDCYEAGLEAGDNSQEGKKTETWKKPTSRTPAEAPVWWWCEGHQKWELRLAGGVDPDHTGIGWVVLVRENDGPPPKDWRPEVCHG